MPYATSNPPTIQAQAIAGGSHWRYASTDVHTDVDAPGYFTNGYALGMKVGDTMHVIETDNSYAQTTHSVTVVTAGGAATISAAT
jgi:hypothetical protein